MSSLSTQEETFPNKVTAIIRDSGTPITLYNSKFVKPSHVMLNKCSVQSCYIIYMNVQSKPGAIPVVNTKETKPIFPP